MYQIINEYDFTRAFKRMGRGEQFSYSGLLALYEWCEEVYSEGNGLELDVIALCCDFAEYDSIKDYNQQLDEEFNNIDELLENCIVIPIDGGGFITEQY